MSIDAALILGLIAVIMAVLFNYHSTARQRLQWVFVVLAAGTSVLSMVPSNEFVDAKTVRLLAFGVVSLPWWVLGTATLFAATHDRGWRWGIFDAAYGWLAFGWIAVGILSGLLPLSIAYWVAAVLWFLVAMTLTLIRRYAARSPQSSIQNRFHLFVLVLAIGASFLMMMRLLYRMEVPSAQINVSDQLLQILMLLITIYLPIYESLEANIKIAENNKLLINQIAAIREAVGVLVGDGPLFNSGEKLGLVVTDEKLTIQYQNSIAKALFNDGSNLLRGVKLQKIINGHRDIRADQLSRQNYVLIEPLSNSQRSMVEIKSIRLPAAIHQHVFAFSLRRVIADAPVLEYWAQQTSAHSQEPIWICDELGNIVHVAGASISNIGPIFGELGEIGDNLLARLGKQTQIENSLMHVSTCLAQGLDASVRLSVPQEEMDRLFHFQVIYVGRSSVSRFAVRCEVMPKLPPLLSVSRVNSADLES